jgi:outer membrane protein, heavy metal efflux system
MRRVVFCAVLRALLVPVGAGAQSLPLTEAEALARLSAESPRVRAIQAAIDLARADVVAAGRWPNPRLTMNRESVAGTTEFLTTIVQPLPISGQRALQVQAASAAVDAAEIRARDLIRRARSDLRLAFADLVAAQAREQELLSSRDRVRTLADVLVKREAAGDAAGFDRLRAEREVLDLDADVALARSDLVRAQAALAGFFVEPTDIARIVAVQAPRPRTIPAVDTLVQQAETNRGDLLALQREADAARLFARAADKRRIPDPEVVAGTKSSNSLGGDLGSVLGFQLTVPLFDSGGPERAAAAARLSQAEARAAALKFQLRAEIAGLVAALNVRRDAADRYRSSALTGADQISRIAQISYDAGERSILELLDAYRTVTSARVRQSALDLAVRQLEIELEFVSGAEIK